MIATNQTISETIANLEIINSQIINLNALNPCDPYRGRRFNPDFEDSPYKGSTALIDGFMARQYQMAKGGIIEVKHKTIAAHIKRSIKTSQRGIKRLESDGRLIVLRHWKNAYIYIPKGRSIDDINNLINAINSDTERVKSWRQNVSNLGTKCPQDILIRETSLETRSDPPSNDPPIPDQNRPIEKQKADPSFGDLHEEIVKTCEEIKAVKPAEKRFNPWAQAVIALRFYMPIIILAALRAMAKPATWDLIEKNGTGLFRSKLALKAIDYQIAVQNENERQHINQHRQRIEEEKSYCNDPHHQRSVQIDLHRH